MLKNIALTAVTGTIYQYIHVAFQGSFACITVGLIVGALAERIRFSAVLIFVVVWFTLSYIPIAHMVWGGGLLAAHGALDFAGGTVVHINAAIAGLVGAYLIGKRVGFGKEHLNPITCRWSLPVLRFCISAGLDLTRVLLVAQTR
ncbi:ammonium transporter [Salmonella enterica subsp. enterica]|uniref:Ammonium transporter n=1 Tax=Salmonella enterica I TaxID=59201 RepID=A0A379WZA9_SALET|nr:ammonium transporter [Salmonella enterica subsp. enterica]